MLKIYTTLLISLIFAPQTQAAVKAEWHKAKTIIMHTPEEELFFGVLHPNAGLNEKVYHMRKAKEEHQTYINKLRAEGVEVHTIKSLLLKGTLTNNNQPRPGRALTKLRDFAERRLQFDISKAVESYSTEMGVSESQARATLTREVSANSCSTRISKFSDQYKRLCVINAMHPEELVKVIFSQPVVHLDRTSINSGTIGSYSFEKPEMNLYFTRDSMMTTAKGIIMGKMNSRQRLGEPEIVKFALRKLGITPLHEVNAPGKMEGGDYIPAGEAAFIANGLRTNYHAINQLLQRDLFGHDKVVVINESWRNQAQMHLDTYFNIIGEGLATIVESRLRTSTSSPEERMRLTADVWVKNPSPNQTVLETVGLYSKISQEIDFQALLEEQMGYSIIPVSTQDQLDYGVNYLTVSDKKGFFVDGVSRGYLNRLSSLGIETKMLDFTNLKGGWGAAHCTVQVIERVDD